MDIAAGDTCPALKDGWQGLGLFQSEENMHMVRHDDVTPQAVTLVVDMMQSLLDDLGDGRMTKNSGTVACIKGFIQLVRKQSVVAGFGDFIPRFQMVDDESLPLCMLGIHDFSGQ